MVGLGLTLLFAASFSVACTSARVTPRLGSSAPFLTSTPTATNGSMPTKPPSQATPTALVTPTKAPVTPKPTPTPKPTKTPVPQPNDGQLIYACGSRPIATAAKYTGSYHPLVVVVNNGSSWSVDDGSSPTYSVDSRWVANSWTSPLQLVVCLAPVATVKARSCGRFTDSEGDSLVEVAYKYEQTARVRIAKTGAILQTKTFVGSTPKCDSNIWASSGTTVWNIYGSAPSTSTINAYAIAVSKQKAK